MIEDGFIRSDLFGKPPRNDRSWPPSTPSGEARFLAFPSVHEADVERQQRAICAIRLAAGKIALNRDRLRRAGKQIPSLAGGMAGHTLSDMGDNAVAAATPRRIRTSV
jgi:hypothetical protein